MPPTLSFSRTVCLGKTIHENGTNAVGRPCILASFTLWPCRRRPFSKSFPPLEPVVAPSARTSRKFITANLTRAELETVLGSRFFDRLFGTAFAVLEFGFESKRQSFNAEYLNRARPGGHA